MNNDGQNTRSRHSFNEIRRYWKDLLLIIIIILIFIPSTIASSINYNNSKNCLSTLRIGGSTALSPLVTQALKAYKTQQCLSNSLIPSVGETGSIDGLKQLTQNNLDVGDSDVFADPTQKNILQDHQIAVVIFVLIIHISNDQPIQLNSIPGLKTSQIQGIYHYFYRNWDQINSAIPNTPIIVISRPPSSGTRAIFGQYVLTNPETGPGTAGGDTSAGIADQVCNTPDAIGYVSMYYYYNPPPTCNKNHLKILTIDGLQPTLDGVKKGYPFWSIEHMYTNKKKPDELAQKFVTFMYSTTVKTYIENFAQFGYLDINDIPDVLNSHLLL